MGDNKLERNSKKLQIPLGDDNHKSLIWPRGLDYLDARAIAYLQNIFVLGSSAKTHVGQQQQLQQQRKTTLFRTQLARANCASTRSKSNVLTEYRVTETNVTKQNRHQTKRENE
jgi:hypothetical protein